MRNQLTHAQPLLSNACPPSESDPLCEHGSFLKQGHQILRHSCTVSNCIFSECASTEMVVQSVLFLLVHYHYQHLLSINAKLILIIVERQEEVPFSLTLLLSCQSLSVYSTVVWAAIPLVVESLVPQAVHLSWSPIPPLSSAKPIMGAEWAHTTDPLAIFLHRILSIPTALDVAEEFSTTATLGRQWRFQILSSRTTLLVSITIL